MNKVKDKLAILKAKREGWGFIPHFQTNVVFYNWNVGSSCDKACKDKKCFGHAIYFISKRNSVFRPNCYCAEEKYFIREKEK